MVTSDRYAGEQERTVCIRRGTGRGAGSLACGLYPKCAERRECRCVWDRRRERETVSQDVAYDGRKCAYDMEAEANAVLRTCS